MLRILLLTLLFSISCALAGDADEIDPVLLEMAKKLAIHADSRSPEFLGSYWDVEAFVGRVMPEKSDNEQVQFYLNQVRKRMKGLGEGLLKGIEERVSIRLVSVQKRSGAVHAILSAHQDIRLVYFGFVLQKNAERSASVVDFYDLSGGLNASDEMRQFVLGSLDEKTANSVFGAESGGLSQHLRKLPLINRAMDAGNGLEVLQLIDSMPVKMQAWRSVRMAKIAAAATCDEALMLRTLEQFEADYPNDPSLASLTFARLYAQMKYAEALVSLNKIEAFVGKDAWLDFVRSRIRQDMGNLNESRRSCQAALQAFPNALDVHYHWATILYEQKDFNELVKAFTAMRKVPRGKELADEMLRSVDFALFVKSAEYQAWKEK